MNIAKAASAVLTPQPCLIVLGEAKEVYLVIEKKCVCKAATGAIILLFCSFYAFNLHYPHLCTTFYQLLETLFLNKPVPGRKPRLASVVAQLHEQKKRK